jgi:hypothetical protein
VDLKQAFFKLGISDRETECRLISRNPEKIEVVVISTRDNVLKAKKEQIDEFWAEWKRVHSDDENNPIASLAKIERTNKNLTLFVRTKTFADHLFGLSTRNGGLGFTPYCLDNGNALALSVGAITLTFPSAEYPYGCVIFSKRKETALNCGEYTLLPSGYVDPFKFRTRDGPRCFINPEESLRLESKEELPGLFLCRGMKVMGLLYTQSKQPMIAFAAKASSTTEQAKSILDSEKADREIGNYVFVPADIENLKAFLRDNNVCSDAAYRVALWVADNHK